MDIEKRLKRLERKVEQLIRAPHGKRTKQMTDFIMEMIEDGPELITVIKKEAKKRGFSWQMICRVKRENLEVDTVIGKKGKGWSWQLKK